MQDCQRQKAEKELDRDRTLRRSLIEAIPEALFYLSPDTGFQGCNRAFEQLFGLTEENIVRKRPGEIFGLELAGVMQPHINAVLRSGEPRHFEHWLETPDGRRVLLETKQNPCYSAQGEILGLVSLSRDITALKNLESDLEEQRRRLELVIFAANIGVWEWLVPTGEMMINEYSAGLLGYDLEELAPLTFQTWTALCHPEDLAQFKGKIAQYFAGEVDYYDCECRLRHKEGRWVWVQTRGSVVQWTAACQPWRLSGTHTDVTARQEAEDQLRLANETLEQRVRERTQALQETHSKMVMQEKMAALGQLAAGIAHEINNPIHFIRTNNASLSQDVTDLVNMLHDYRGLLAELETDDRWAEKLAAMRAKEADLRIDYILNDISAVFPESERGFDRIARIIHSMRTFSHTNCQGRPSLGNINQGIEDTLVLAQNVYKHHTEVCKDLGDLPKIFCFPEQLNQVFLNLIVNSSQAITAQNRPEKGRIAIRTWYEAGMVYCEIADNGPGIPEASRSRIFEPFFTTKEPGQGTGLGLSISYDIIVNKHHGDLAVHCPESGGTVFTIRLPANLPVAEGEDDACQ